MCVVCVTELCRPHYPHLVRANGMQRCLRAVRMRYIGRIWMLTIAIIVNGVIAIGQYLLNASIAFHTTIDVQMGEKFRTIVGCDAARQLLLVLTPAAYFQRTTNLKWKWDKTHGMKITMCCCSLLAGSSSRNSACECGNNCMCRRTQPVRTFI